MKKQKGKVTIIVAIIGAISTIAAACISGYFNYKAGADKTEKEIDNKIVQETQIVVDGSDNAVDYLIEENKKLEVDLEGKEAEISKLKNENEQLQVSLDQSEKQNMQNNVSDEKETTDQTQAQSYSLLDVCPPYDGEKDEDKFVTNSNFIMGGKAYSDGFSYWGRSLENYLLFNLDGKYSKLEFDFGHIDNESDYDATIEIVLDGKSVQTIEKKWDELVTHEVVDLNYAKQLKLCFQSGDGAGYARYGFANVKIYE